MFKWFFKRENQSETVDPELAISRKSAIRSELAMRASIADKLRNYRADEDTTISKFTLADDEAERKHEMKLTQVKTRDAWGQANPGETGKWNKEDRLTKVRTNSGGLR
jgi:hypothetical protein